MINPNRLWSRRTTSNTYPKLLSTYRTLESDASDWLVVQRAGILGDGRLRDRPLPSPHYSTASLSASYLTPISGSYETLSSVKRGVGAVPQDADECP